MQFKKMLFRSAIILALTILILGLSWFWQQQLLTRQMNQQLASVLTVVKQRYPQVSNHDLATILNQTSSTATLSLRDYGINLQHDNLILGWQQTNQQFIFLNLALVGLALILLLINFCRYNRQKDRALQAIVADVAAINRHDYRFKLADYDEDELAILKNQLHKTTLLLRETADHSQQDKLKLKQSLADISHQIKTPITSIEILIDNILDNPEMPLAVRADFLQRIKREVTSLDFLIAALLKLSKFDAATVEFHDQSRQLGQIVAQAVERVSVLADLHEINFKISGPEPLVLVDEKWQIEAIANILKNSIEHSPIGATIELQYAGNKVYQSLAIIDQGSGIAAADLKHLFERFYETKTPTNMTNNYGIGLALAKTIIEQDHGDLTVRSQLGVGSQFMIKYFDH
ncbi:sensor histidine kinase [Lapidilactobacillus wuchangensis]|uniref:sensor histidine kinase n=1 Tax=Lapidilactobacillus wuchangensis TaxID=2486001 RepID=UPI0013DE656F|nr:HAMP domain-containing sensor histidine kinase [Lapidilactobacillus wuchangensis]